MPSDRSTTARPAETAGAAGAVALVVCLVAGVDDPETIGAVGIVAGLVPSFVTLIVASGGLRGIGRKIMGPRR